MKALPRRVDGTDIMAGGCGRQGRSERVPGGPEGGEFGAGSGVTPAAKLRRDCRRRADVGGRTGRLPCIADLGNMRAVGIAGGDRTSDVPGHAGFDDIVTTVDADCGHGPAAMVLTPALMAAATEVEINPICG